MGFVVVFIFFYFFFFSTEIYFNAKIIDKNYLYSQQDYVSHILHGETCYFTTAGLFVCPSYLFRVLFLQSVINF